jgi:GTP cyclohydrolase I
MQKVGLSKLGRVVDILSHRLQLQERLTAQIGEIIFKKLQPQGIIVTRKAKHTCLICRGIKKYDSSTVSFFKKGEISEQQVKMMLEI